MYNYLVLKNNIVDNKIIFEELQNEESLAIFKNALEADSIVLDENNSIYIGAEYSDGVFINPKPFSSWVLNEETLSWEPPTPMPNDGIPRHWDEGSLSWTESVL